MIADRLPGTRVSAAAGAVLLLGLLACPPHVDQPEPRHNGIGEEWLWGPEPGSDLIRAADSPARLRSRFGARQVRDDSIAVGEGMFERGTLLFPRDSSRTVAVQWDADDRPGLVRISDSAGSAWRVHPGAGIGTTLEELESLNGGAFELYGFGWDYEGTTAGWLGGRLEELWGDRILVRLRPTLPDAELLQRVLGDRVYRSDLPVMRALRPAAYEILVRPR